MKRYVVAVWSLTRALTIRWLRDPTALFLLLVLPLIFLLVLGALSRTNSVSFSVALINDSRTPLAAQVAGRLGQETVFKIKHVTGLEDAKQRMGRGELDAIIQLPPDFGAANAAGLPSGKLVTYNQESKPDTGKTVASLAQQALGSINQRLAGSSDRIAVEQRPVKTANLTRFDYVVAGVVGLSIMAMAVFGMSNTFPFEKKSGALRRLRATPLKSSQLILATALEYLLFCGLAVVIMFAVSAMLFGFHIRGNYLTLALFVAIGIVCMFGFGMAIGGWAKNEKQSGPVANFVAAPMLFLSGVFFPTYLMPEWLQTVGRYLPLTPIIEGVRRITTEHASLVSLGPELAIIGVWTVIIYAVAFKVFRWE